MTGFNYHQEITQLTDKTIEETDDWKEKDEIKKNWRLGAEYDAHMSPDERRKLLKNWKHAVNSALFWAEAAEK